MYFRTLVLVLSLSSGILATYFINVDDYWKELTANISPRESTFDIKGFLNGYGYPFESHEVTTKDGYILGLHRIPHGKSETANEAVNKRKPAVLIMHGLEGSSVDFFVLGPEKSLALILADLGYDVWLGNNRGNTWSRNHTSLDPDINSTFWDFSFHELGVYDSPALIDHIVNETGNEKITYIGHAQGSTQFFVMASELSDYNKKITVMAALAPLGFMQNMTNPIMKALAGYSGIVEFVINKFNLTEIVGHSSTLSSLLEIVCSDDSGLQELCVTAMFLFVGFDGEQLDRGTYSSVFENLPAGASARQFLHYFQEINSGHFRPYDYGETKNSDVYNNSVPPDYNLKAVTAPVALYYSENDLMVDAVDVEKLATALPNVVEKHLIEYKRFNHLDYVLAKDAYSLLYYDLINFINGHNNLDPVVSTPTTTTTTTTAPKTTTKPATTSESTDSPGTGTTSVPKTTPGSASIPSNSMQGLCGLILLIAIKLVV